MAGVLPATLRSPAALMMQPTGGRPDFCGQFDRFLLNLAVLTEENGLTDENLVVISGAGTRI